MANVHDYLYWRGDLTFAERPFNDVDNLILSMLAYLDLTDIVPTEGEGSDVSLLDACTTFVQRYQGNMAAHVRSLAKIDQGFVEALGASRRFRDVRLSAYEDVVSKRRSLQFAALQADLPDAGTYVAYRGTDTTIVGWRENFMLSFTVTEAQREAVRYLTQVILRTAEDDAIIRVGGHSKGGNLAEFAAASCPEHLRRRIARVYSNDGPGMAPGVSPIQTREVLGNTFRHIVPRYSVIGMLFEPNGSPRTIVASSAVAIEQHDPTTWQVLPDRFQTSSALDPDCLPLNLFIAQWADGVALEERQRIVAEVFDALQAGGATTFDEIAQTPDRLQQVINALGTMDRRTREVALELIHSAVGSSVDTAMRATIRAIENTGRRIMHRGQVHAGTIRREKGRGGLKVYIDA